MSVKSTLAVICLALAAALALATSGAGGDSEGGAIVTVSRVLTPPPVPISVRVDLSHPGRPVPARYLGLSFEETDLSQIASYGERGDMVTLLRSLGPGLLRFGGVSSDTRIAWKGAQTPAILWTERYLEAGDFRALRKLAEESDWRVLLTVGLVHYDPSSAAREVLAAKQALGSWLAGIEVGNEPDAYARHRLRTNPWTFARYNAQVRSYRRAIAKLVPGISLAGPGVSGSRVYEQWGPKEAVTEQPAILTGHHYPLGCHQVPAPSITRLLSGRIRGEEDDSLARYMAVSRASGIPFRMDETGSVSCGGQAGISNTFASTLWATNYIAQSMAAGVSGMNFEGNPANCLGYSPVCAPTPGRLTAGILTAQPVWYALLLTRGLVGDRPLPTYVAKPRGGANLTVTSLAAPDGSLRFVVVEDEAPGHPGATLSLHVGAQFGKATDLPMTAPSLASTSGVTIGGHAVSPGGTWSSPQPSPAAVRAGVVTVQVPAGSAALITVSR